MNSSIKRMLLLTLVATGTHSRANAAATMPATTQAALPDATLDRGNAVRLLLRDTLERAYADDQRWPATIDVPAGMSYSPPAAQRTTLPAGSVQRASDPRATTIVLAESFAQHADGVWIGYADGHLEFCRTPAELDACRAGRAIAAAATPYDETNAGPPPATATLALRVRHSDGTPAANAHVGTWWNTGDLWPSPQSGPTFLNEGAATRTDVDGAIVLRAADVFDAKFSLWRTAPVWIATDDASQVACVTVSRDNFAVANPPSRDVTLASSCRVNVVVTSLGARERGTAVSIVLGDACAPLAMRQYTVSGAWHGDALTFALPPGDWCLSIRSNVGDGVVKYVRVGSGQRTLDCIVDLPVDRLTALVGQPAPDLTAVKAWKNTPPLKLADLRGKVVLLDFWGHWCNPCCEAMPALMKLYDEFHSQGLEIIAMHDDSLESIAALDEKLMPIRARQWGGRELPFPVALDGGGETRVRYTSRVVNGATCAAYGVSSWPTTIAIGRDGRVIGEFGFDDADSARKQILSLLQPTTRPER